VSSMLYFTFQVDTITKCHETVENVSWRWRHKSSSPTSLRMRINTRELEQMLLVDVRVQTKVLGPQGYMPFPH